MQAPPQGAGNGSSSWEVAAGLLYPEDVMDDSPYLFSELPQRMTGGYSFNTEPLYIVVRGCMLRSACAAAGRAPACRPGSEGTRPLERDVHWTPLARP